MSQDADTASHARAGLAPSRRLVLIAFTLIGTGILTITLFAVAQTRALGMRGRDIVDNMLTSVRLAGRIQNDVEKEQNLIDEHIIATDAAEMTPIEGRLASLREETAAKMLAYDPWATLPGERATWDQTRADLASLREPTVRALALSRENRDAEAREAMQLVFAQFVRVERDLDKLISINDQGATASLAQVSLIQLRLMLTILGLGLTALVGTLLVGRWAARQIGRREDEAALRAKHFEDRNRELDAFAGRVAHDIRSPLTIINLAVTQLAAKFPHEERVTALIGRGVKRMGTLVDDLLMLARVEAQAPGCCDPATVAAQIQTEFLSRPEAEDAKLRVAVEHAAVSCSEGLLHQALANLTENAVKYRRLDLPAEVEIAGVAVEDGYDLRISDNGVGMDPESAKHAFEPFYRSPRTQSLPGTGLGLSIVNRVAQASNGTLSVRTQLGQGCTFTLHLPLAERQHRTDRVDP